jgi:hypothetical protein
MRLFFAGSEEQGKQQEEVLLLKCLKPGGKYA